MSKNTLNVQNLSLSVPNVNHVNFFDLFRSKNDFHLLHNINFHLKSGEILGLIGINGSGKSTLLKCLSNIFTNYQGSVQIHGRIAPLLELGVGFRFDLTGVENIHLILNVIGVNHVTKNLEDKIINFSGLSKESINLKLKFYSSGMVARLAFSILIEINYEILLLDEVLSVGDKDFLVKSKKVIMNKIKNSKTAIITSHDESLIRELCNKVLLLHKGKQIFFGDVNNGFEIYNSKKYKSNII